VVRFRQHEGDLPMVAVRAEGSGPETVRVLAFDSAGQTVVSETLQGSLRDLDYRAGRAMLLFYGQLTIIDATGDAPLLESREAGGARKALCGTAGQGVLIYSGRATGVSLDLTAG
jgi:Cu/Zn superoxide dismutase